MSIKYFEEERVFKLDTDSTSYILGVVDTEGFLGHIYYGRKLQDYRLTYRLRTDESPFVPSCNNRDRVPFLDAFPMEYSTQGVGDFRETCLMVQNSLGNNGVALFYDSHCIFKGKPALENLPATFGEEGACETLEIVCLDKVLGLEVTLSYTVFEKVDVITRSVKVKNNGQETLKLKKVLSCCMDMDDKEFDMITLHGAWARERHIQRRRIGYGKQSVCSVRGESSHQEHPFMALANHQTTQDSGEVYGFHFIYSGNFLAQAEKNQYDQVRVVVGIHPEGFEWVLEPGISFQAPEVVYTYSCEGINGMTHNLHNLYRNHLIRSPYKDKKRPILINNWEATYFDFDEEKLYAIAKEAKAYGIEMLVMDDGWFGCRNDDNTSLGDWEVNERKFKGGLKKLVDRINGLGMAFGIWFEPEMISPDSDLYRSHSDWAIQIRGREAALCRNQYVLDLSRKEVRDYMYEAVAKILRSANITYVKWDMNRQLSDLGSFALPYEKQGELHHRYVLGVYELQERLMKEFPYLLLENCSGGGARFDPGMLYYSPQIWCSDDTDAIERLSIQEGTAMIYPLSTIGSHVSDCPNHTVGRTVPFETRGYVALAGTFGYELDITKISEEDRTMIKGQTEMYHKYSELVQQGDYYRLASYSENHLYDAWQVVSKDKSEALVTYIQVMGQPNVRSKRIFLRGLQPDRQYQIEGTDEVYFGDVLMYSGIQIKGLHGDYKGKLLYLTSLYK